jgi:hypothetical protein
MLSAARRGRGGCRSRWRRRRRRKEYKNLILEPDLAHGKCPNMMKNVMMVMLLG